MNYFKDCKSVQAIKKLYRQLALKNHPDKGGDLRTMQTINIQYTTALKTFDNTTQDNYTYHYNEYTEKSIMDKIYDIISKNMNINISLIGSWIWITGNTKPYKNILKELKCKWHSKRKCWYWHNERKRKFYSKSDVTLEELAEKYGYKDFSRSKNSVTY